MPQQPTFEDRMRRMVLGAPTRRRTEAAAPSSQTRSNLPPNVQTIESLQDYKRVVGDEREKIVAVRFYATYCKVSVADVIVELAAAAC